MNNKIKYHCSCNIKIKQIYYSLVSSGVSPRQAIIKASWHLKKMHPEITDDELEEFDNYNLVFATTLGNIRKNKMKDVAMSGTRKLARSGKTAIKLKTGDRLIGVISVIENDDVQLATTNGKSIRFATKDLREFSGLGSSGVRGIKLSKDDKVVSICSLLHNKISIDGSTSLSVSDDYKKRFESYGWNFIEINGHNYKQISNAIKKASKSNKPNNLHALLKSFLLLVSPLIALL